MNIYDVGDLVRCTCSFTDADGDPIDPTAVYLVFTDPSGTTTTYQYGVDLELVKQEAGTYYADIDADSNGIWNVRVYSTGSGQAADEWAFAVRESEF